MHKPPLESIDPMQRIPIIEERARISVETVPTSEITIRKTVDLEEFQQQVDLFTEKVEIERISKNEYVDAVPAIRREGDVTVIPVVKEVLVKKLVLVEEIHLYQRKDSERVAVKERLRTEHIHIEENQIKE